MSYKREVLSDGSPLFYFRMEGRGNDVFLVDASGNGLTPAADTPRTWGVQGPIADEHGRALRVVSGTLWSGMTRQSMTASQTRACWVRTTDLDSTSNYGGDPALSIMGDTTGSVWDGFGVHNGKAEFRRFNNSAWQVFSSAKTVADGRWHFIAATYDSTTRAVQIVVDGAVDATGTVSAHQAQGGVNVIGRGFHGSDVYIGDLDEVEAWSSVLSVERLRRRYLVGSRRFANRRSGRLVPA